MQTWPAQFYNSWAGNDWPWLYSLENSSYKAYKAKTEGDTLRALSQVFGEAAAKQMYIMYVGILCLP